MKLPRTRKEILSLASFAISILLFAWALKYPFYDYSPQYSNWPDQVLSYKDFILIDLDGFFNLFNPMLWTCNLGLLFLWWSYVVRRRVSLLIALSVFVFTTFLLGSSSLFMSRHYDEGAYLWLSSILLAGLATQAVPTSADSTNPDFDLSIDRSCNVFLVDKLLNFLSYAVPPIPIALFSVAQISAFIQPRKSIEFPDPGLMSTLGILLPFAYPIQDVVTYIALSLVSIWLMTIFARRLLKRKITKPEAWAISVAATISLIAHAFDNNDSYMSGGAFLWLMSVYTGAVWAYHGHPKTSKEIQWTA